MVDTSTLLIVALTTCFDTISISAWSSIALSTHCNQHCRHHSITLKYDHRSISTTTRLGAIIDNSININSESPPSNNNNNESSNNKVETGSTAIILNLNARSVSGSSKQLISLASSIVGEEHVYVTRTIEDALLAARRVVRRGRCGNTTTLHDGNDYNKDDGVENDGSLQPYSLVVPVGGDGTLSGWIDGMVNEILLLEQLNATFTDSTTDNSNDDDDDVNNCQMKVHEAVGQLPTVGYIPMGTGNGLGYVIGCRMPKSTKCNTDGTESKTKKKRWRDKLTSKLSLKRRKVEHAGRVMQRLKLIGDELKLQTTKHQHHQLNTYEQNNNEYSIVEMPLMEVTHHSPHEQTTTTNTTNTKGDLCFFAGSGFDSLMLEDFKQVKAWSKSSQRTPSFIKDMLGSVAGYCVALVTKTLPQTLLHQTHKISVKVTTTDVGTLWIDHRRGDFSELAIDQSVNKVDEVVVDEHDLDDGDEVTTKTTTTTKKKKKQKHLIYSGITGILAASTTPFYGGGMRLFPYARLFPNKLQLRIGRISPLTGFFRIPAIFDGSYRDKSEGDFGCLDFVGDDFEVEVSSTRYEEYLKRKKEGKKSRQWGWRRRRRRRRKNGTVGDEVTNDEDEATTTSPSTGFPFQHSGESMGIKESFRVRVVKQPVKFISFLKPRIVVDE